MDFLATPLSKPLISLGLPTGPKDAPARFSFQSLTSEGLLNGVAEADAYYQEWQVPSRA
jgi:hypothetical protein